MNRMKNIAYKGFTLIELLVVVTLIAILAVAVLATINPIEQRNRARDTAIKQTAADIIAAQERFFSVYGCYTWSNSAASTATAVGPCNAAATTYSGSVIPSATNKIHLLTVADEIKVSLENRLNQNPYSTITLVEDGSNVLHAYFTPTSQVFRDKATCSNTCNCAAGSGTLYCVPDIVD